MCYGAFIKFTRQTKGEYGWEYGSGRAYIALFGAKKSDMEKKSVWQDFSAS